MLSKQELKELYFYTKENHKETYDRLRKIDCIDKVKIRTYQELGDILGLNIDEAFDFAKCIYYDFNFLYQD